MPQQQRGLHGKSATGGIAAGADNQQDLNQDLERRHFGGLIGGRKVET